MNGRLSRKMQLKRGLLRQSGQLGMRSLNGVWVCQWNPSSVDFPPPDRPGFGKVMLSKSHNKIMSMFFKYPLM